MDVRRRFRFPNPVNDLVARTVAAGVLLQALAFLVTRWPLFLVTLAVGFVLRVLAGPRWSPLALLASRVIVPRLPFAPKMVPGPPKRFAQGIGATVTTAAVVAWVAAAHWLSFALVGLIVVAATLESVFAICIGCRVFAGLMRIGIIPASVCADCADISTRVRERAAAGGS
jgi:hypothetical protein